MSDQPPPVPEPPGSFEPGRLYRLAWVLYLGLAVAAVVWIGLREGAVPLSLFLAPEDLPRDLAAGLAAGALLLGAWELSRRTLATARRLEAALVAILGGLTASEVVALAVLSGLAEELFFRGALLGAFEQHGWLWSSLAFALLHGGPGSAFRMWTVFAFVAGLVFAGLVLWSGHLLPAVLAHFLVNAVNLGRLGRRAREAADGEDPAAVG